MIAALAMPLTVSVPALDVRDPPAINDELPESVMLAALVIPFMVNVPELAVIEPEPATTIDELPVRVTLEELVMPLMVNTPPLAVIEPRCAVVTYSVGEVIVAELVGRPGRQGVVVGVGP